MAKVLLMGPSGGGKTSMRSMVFSNYLARDTARLGPTTHTHTLKVNFLGKHVLNMWDCGGQSRYVDEYLSTRRPTVFSGVAMLIYTCDVSALGRDAQASPAPSDEANSAQAATQYWSYPQILENLSTVMTSVREFSPDARLFVILHKTDLIAQDQREMVISVRRREMVEALPAAIANDVTFFATNIWDDSLFDAWAAMLKYLLPSMKSLHDELRSLSVALGARELILFERSTFLSVARVSAPGPDGGPSAAKVSNALKHFRLACHKTTNPFVELVFALPKLLSVVIPFGANTFIMAVFTDPGITPTLARMNLEAAKAVVFQRLDDNSELTELRTMM